MFTILFPIITVPYVSRILQTENYGKYNFGNSVISYFSLLASLGITNYAIREGSRVRDDRDKINKFSNEVYSINLIATIVSYIILLIAIVLSTKLNQYVNLILVQSISIILTTLGADWVNSIYEDYFYITMRYLIIHIISLCAMFLFVRTTEDYVIYAAISVFASSGGNILNLFYIRKYVYLKFTIHTNYKVHLQRMILFFASSIMATVYINSDMLMLGFMCSEYSVGVYSLATRIYTVIKLTLNSMVVVTLSRLSLYLGRGNYEKYTTLTNKVFNALLFIILPAIVGLCMLSSEIILIVGGDDYANGYTALRILGIAAGFAVFASFYFNCIILPYKKEKISLYASTISALVNVILNFLIIPILNYNGAALTTLISEVIVFFIYIYSSRKLHKTMVPRNNIRGTFLGSVFIFVICFTCKIMVDNLYYRVIIAVFASMFTYFIIQFLFKNTIVIQAIVQVNTYIKRKT